MSKGSKSERRQTGEVWALIQAWLDAHPYPPSQNRLAGRLGVSSSKLTDWKYRESWPGAHDMEALAREIGVPYEQVLHAFLVDHGYRTVSVPSTRGA